MDEGLELAVNAFIKTYGKIPDVKVFAPGRVNLIGEHVDYNDGFVLPFALPFRTIIVGSKSSTSSNSRIVSVNINTDNNLSTVPVKFEINDKLSKGQPTWANYIKGTVYQYLNDLPKDAAFDAVIWSNVPMGSGLSSSAALEVATATFLEKLYGLNSISKQTKALRCQKAEHTFADTPCGIMDQYISAMGKAGNLLLIDCRSQQATLVPFGKGKQSAVVVVTNSNVKHKLSGSEYPDRVKQCKEATEIVKKTYSEVTALRDVTLQMLETVKAQLSPLAYKRAKHNITENTRTLTAVDALKRGDFDTVGKMMIASHDSLSSDFEVSCTELDVLKELAIQVPGVYGSRMTGGGFGGCTVTLVDSAAVPALKEHLKTEYLKRTGLVCECYDAEPSPGAGSCDEETSPNADLLASLNWLVPAAVVALAITVGISALRKQ